MSVLIKNMLKKISYPFCVILARLFYPNCPWLVTWNPFVVPRYVLWQKILNVNKARRIEWPVHFTSHVSGDMNVGTMTSPGYSLGCYINGMNGIDFGDNVYIGPGVKIISANHNIFDYSKHDPVPPIQIGNDVWLGANAIVLPSVSIGDGAIIGAGAVVTKSLPKNCIAVGNPAKVIRYKEQKSKQ